VVSLDTRGRSGVTVRYRLRDIDASSIANAVQPVALQYRVGAAGPFAAVPGGFVADATTGPGAATLTTPVSAVLPVAAEDQPLVQLRILTTNAVGEDEWVGVDDIEVEAGGHVCGPPGPVPPQPPDPVPPQPPGPPHPLPPALTALTVYPATFTAAKRGPAVTQAGRTGTSLRFRLSRPAKVEFRVTSPRLLGQSRMATGGTRARETLWARVPLGHREAGHFSIRGRRGLNRLRFTGRVRGLPLPAGRYRLTAQAIDRAGLASPPASISFRIR
jgi:hypothetical protein